MVTASDVTSTKRYGPYGFSAAMVNILFIEFTTLALLPWVYLTVFVIPLLLLDVAVSVYFRGRAGTLGEIGRGMLIGCIAGPAALAFFIPLYFLAAATGLI
jgi:hypothetical protein